MANAFHLDVTDDGIGLLTFDTPGQKVNTLSGAILAELFEVVAELEGRSNLRGLIFSSGKPGQFVAGADLGELAALPLATPQQVARGIERGHELFNRISQLPFPTIAAVNGYCMGGGTELILSMDQRLLSDHPNAGIALPEVKVGLIPAWGGTQRLPRLIGVDHAIIMITNGTTVRGDEAVSLGLVSDVVATNQLISTSRRVIEKAHTNGDWIRQRTHRQQALNLTSEQTARTYAAAQEHIKTQTGNHYLAPLMALKAVRDGIHLPLARALIVEKEIAAKIMQTPSAANLINVFFKRNQINHNPGIDLRANIPTEVGRIGVLGSRRIGASIATAFVNCGPVELVDPDESNSSSLQILADCDLVIVADPENESLTTSLFSQLADIMKPEAILACNTSTILISALAKSTPAADRFIGMHFCPPTDRMSLVEVIPGRRTSDETVATVVALAKRIGKTPLVVRDRPGFLVNRVLMPYLAEAVLMLTEGASMDAIDELAIQFGMANGPFDLLDLIGIDVVAAADEVLTNTHQDDTVFNQILKRLVKRGRIGVKIGSGFRRHSSPQHSPESDPDFDSILAPFLNEPRPVSSAEITDRLFLSMLLEAVRALEDQIVNTPAHVDMAMILGAGFPDFQGGLLGWADNQTAAQIIARSSKYKPLSPRFESPPMLAQMARSGQRFFPLPPPNARTFGG